MADILVFPNISFDETDVGPREIIPTAGNRIGVVGKFLKGSKNRFELINSRMLAEKFGKTKEHNGSIAIQTASDQGANDFGVVRVMGSGTVASASLKFYLNQALPAISSRERITLLSTAFKMPFLGNGVDKGEVLAQRFANAIMDRFASIRASYNGNIVSITTPISEAQSLPIMLLCRKPLITSSSDLEETGTKITVTVSDKITDLYADGAGSKVLDAAAASSNKSESSVFRLSNGELHIKFEVQKDVKDNSSADIHVMLGADAVTEPSVTTIARLTETLRKSCFDRRIGFSCESPLNDASSTIIMKTRLDKFPESNFTKFVVMREIIGSGSFDSQLKMEYKPGGANQSVQTLVAGQLGLFGGAVAGPSKGFVAVRANKFVRSEIKHTLFIDDASKNTEKITFTAGEIALNKDDKLYLKDSSGNALSIVVFNNGTTSQVIYAIKENGILTLKAQDASLEIPANGLALGTYLPESLNPTTTTTTSTTTSTTTTTTTAAPAAGGSGSTPAATPVVTPAAGKGLFTPNPAVNGDILRIVAASEGGWSSNCLVSVVKPAGVSDNLILLKLDYVDQKYSENNISETYEIYLDKIGVLDESVPYPMVVASRNSVLANIFYVGETESNKYLQTEEFTSRSFQGGFDGPEPSSDDWVDAINVLSQSPVNIIIASGNTSSQVRNALISQAEQSDEITGLRIAVLSAERNLDILAARQLTANLDSKHAVMVGGHVTYTGRSDMMPLSVPPDGFYAGHLAVTPVQASPAARTSSPAFKNIGAVDIPNQGSLAYNEYTRSRVEMIIPDQVSGSFHCLNGLSLSKDVAWKWICVRRVYNYVRSGCFGILQFAKSEPNSVALRERINSSINNFMYVLQTSGQIDQLNKIKVDDENNPASQIALGILKVDIFFTPVYPADFIRVGLHRAVVPVSFTLSTRV
jgi:hypothetical protein